MARAGPMRLRVVAEARSDAEILKLLTDRMIEEKGQTWARDLFQDDNESIRTYPHEFWKKSRLKKRFKEVGIRPAYGTKRSSEEKILRKIGHLEASADGFLFHTDTDGDEQIAQRYRAAVSQAEESLGLLVRSPSADP